MNLLSGAKDGKLMRCRLLDKTYRTVAQSVHHITTTVIGGKVGVRANPVGGKYLPVDSRNGDDKAILAKAKRRRSKGRTATRDILILYIGSIRIVGVHGVQRHC